MYFPDYGPCVLRVAQWIEADVEGMALDKNLFAENFLPPGPDGAQCVFENGGTWNEDRGWQDWTLQLVTRAADLTDARKLAAITTGSVLERFAKAPLSERGIIQDIQLQSLPANTGRDDRKRVIMETRFLMRIHAEYVIGLERGE